MKWGGHNPNTIRLRSEGLLRTDTLNPAELFPATSRGRSEGLDNLGDYIGPEAGDVVRKAGREVRVHLCAPQSKEEEDQDQDAGQGRQRGRGCVGRVHTYIRDDLSDAPRADVFLPAQKQKKTVWSVGRLAGVGEGTNGLLRSARMASRLAPIVVGVEYE